MRSLIKQGINTIKNDGLVVFTQRIYNYSALKMKRLLQQTNHDNLERWQALKGKFSGQRIFILGNGPSLNEMPLYLLKNEYTMCFNRFGLFHERLNWFPHFYVVTDDLVIQDMHEEINTSVLPLVKYAFFPDIHPSNIEFKSYIDHRKNVYWLNTDKPDFSMDLPSCGINKTVVNAGLQIAAFLGFAEIYLIGVDMTFTDHKVKKINSRNWTADDHDPNHFDPRYFGSGRKYHNPTVHEILDRFKEAKSFFDPKGVKIFNAGIGGKLEVFPRIKFSELFNFNEEQKKSLFTDSISLRDPWYLLTKTDITDIIPGDRKQLTALSEEDVVKTTVEGGLRLIKDLIFTHIPFGPYQNSYYFISRKLCGEQRMLRSMIYAG